MQVPPLNRYDKLASVYDVLAGIAFAGRIRRSQCEFLSHVNNGDCVLVVGGGTGWIVEELFQRCTPRAVYFVDASARMLARARRRGLPGSVIFIHGTVADIPEGVGFDVVILNFFLDMFSQAEQEALITRIQKATHAGSQWLVTDFTDTNFFHHTILFFLYAFFRLTTRLGQRSLANWQAALLQCDLACAASAVWLRGFIKSGVFKRQL